MLFSGISGCTTNLSGDAYSRQDARKVQQVTVGTVQSIRLVVIEGRRSAIGELGGAAVGGVAGSSIGKGKGKAIATVIGAIAGSVAGSAIEEGATKVQGIEMTITLDDGKTIVIVQEKSEKDNIMAGDRVKIMTLHGNSRVAPL